MENYRTRLIRTKKIGFNNSLAEIDSTIELLKQERYFLSIFYLANSLDEFFNLNKFPGTHLKIVAKHDYEHGHNLKSILLNEKYQEITDYTKHKNKYHLENEHFELYRRVDKFLDEASPYQLDYTSDNFYESIIIPLDNVAGGMIRETFFNKRMMSVYQHFLLNEELPNHKRDSEDRISKV